MTAHQLLTLALRVVGFWVLIEAVGSTASTVAMISTPAEWANTYVVILFSVSALSYCSIAALFLLFAPAIASWFYGREDAMASQLTASAIGPHDVYQIAARLLGILSCLSAIEPASRIAPELFVPRFWEQFSSGSWPWAYVVQTISHIVVGVFLITKAHSVADLFARSHGIPSRTDPTAMPNQEPK